MLIDRDAGYVLAGFGDGDGAFAPAAEYAVQGGPAEYAVGDLDLDGALDAFGAGASNGLLVRQNLGGGFFDNAANLPFAGESHSALAADLGADAWPELVVSATDDGEPRLFVWSGAADFAYDAPTEVITPFALRDLVATELGGSPHVDIAAIGNDGEITTLWLARDWDDPCQAAIPVLEGTGQRLTAGDLDGDGDADFAIAMGPRLAFLLQE